MRSEVLTAVLLKMQVFCDVTPFCWRKDSDVSKVIDPLKSQRNSVTFQNTRICKRNILLDVL